MCTNLTPPPNGSDLTNIKLFADADSTFWEFLFDSILYKATNDSPEGIVRTFTHE